MHEGQRWSVQHCLDVLNEEKLIELVTFSDGKELLTRIVSMLTKMVR